MTLVLAGHETTANSLAWTVERLLRAPAAYQRLREVVRSGNGDGDEYVEATVHEGMRVRPVIPMVVRLVKRPWRLGDYVVPAGTPVGMSIVALHHREDVYPDPDQFRPERFVESKPGTYTWIPFGGGIRRCLGASLAMAEQKVVLKEIARRTDMVAPRSRAEGARQRNVTTIPSRGGADFRPPRDGIVVTLRWRAPSAGYAGPPCQCAARSPSHDLLLGHRQRGAEAPGRSGPEQESRIRPRLALDEPLGPELIRDPDTRPAR